MPGYRRINGYERFDGRSEPHAAVYYRLEFDTGTAAISAGNTVGGPDGSGMCCESRSTLAHGPGMPPGC